MGKAWIVSFLLLLAACGAGTDARLAPLARATLSVGEDGVALGNLRLGETTLGECVDRFGSGRTDLVVSDETGLELVFEDGELALLFLYEVNPRSDEECTALRAATRDLPAFLAKYPERRDLRLASVTVAADESRDATFFQGALALGVRLLDPLQESVVRVGCLPDDERPPMLAGMSPNVPRQRACFPELGLVLYGEDEPPPEQPSRVTRISLFLPEEP
jgi:hypothetical protein